ncbi:polysaccharide deacetylase family protein [Oceanobacillus luteolus]|uniref:Polysaccharide deacetylase family protein n=1 Tax=Oceanobacillus luteolus TaxID=1274358 RepID=A0ABW4HN18_9BACI|nr:polysaccharide deacetylase family protein [Oceanobacillus luteolus]MCM3742396.1 polysaccharide deacetylase family protein [Oceanobacillus luteolus]
MRRKNTIYLTIFAVTSVLILGGFANPSAILASPGTDKDNLYQKIESYDEKHKIDPIDAKVDKIWKAIPGYNGLRVDVNESYKNMEKDGRFDASKIVYKEVSPSIHLDDLEPEPIYRGNPQKSMVSLLINVAWGNEYIPKILEVLNEHQVKATFFFDGSWTKKNPDLAMMIHMEGHEIGNHAYSHPDLSQRSKAETMNELTKTNEVIESTLGIKPKWFAPPSGSFNMETVSVANQLNMKTILWTVDTVDWKKPAPSEMVSRVVAKVEKGSMVLMHPTKPVAEGLGAMITNIKAKGYQLGTVSDLMSEKRLSNEFP